MLSLLLRACLVACAMGCESSPSVTQIRLQQLPPRPLLCAIEWLPQFPDPAPDPIGSITVWSGVPHEPMGEAARAILAPRACAMGGNAVALIGVSTGGGRQPVASYAVYATPPSQ
jgi:hypothetical protein